MLKRKWTRLALCALVGLGGMVAGCSDDGKTEEQPQEQQKPEGAFTIDLSPASISGLQKSGSPKAVTITYRKGDAPADGEMSILVKDTKCAQANKSAVTVKNGSGAVQVSATSEEACQTEMEVTSGDGATATLPIKVIDIHDEYVEPEPEDEDVNATKLTVSPAEAEVPANGSNKKEPIVISTDAVKVKAKSVNSECAYPEKGSIAIAGGKGNLVIKGKDKACETTIIVWAGKEEPNDIDSCINSQICATVAVTVVESNLISIQLVPPIKEGESQSTDPNIDKSTDYSGYAYLADDCATAFTSKGPRDVLEAAEQYNSEPSNGREKNKVVHAFTDIDPDYDITAGSKAVLAYTSMDEDDPKDHPTYYGCSDLSSVNNKVLNVNLSPVPKLVKGDYDFVINFDYMSMFKKDMGCDAYNDKGEFNATKFGQCKVENYKLGDWITFVTQALLSPTEAILGFIWTNSMGRVVSDPNSFLGQIVGNVGTAALKPLGEMLDGYFKEKTKTKTGLSIYETVVKVSGDVVDLVSNMQFTGRYQITKDDGNYVIGGRDEFQDIQYQWSLADPEGQGCIENVYGVQVKIDDKTKKVPCHRKLAVSMMSKSLGGEWEGVITPNTQGDDTDALKINAHSLDFKWATMLFNVIFVSILPEALGYNGDDYLKNTNCFNEKCRIPKADQSEEDKNECKAAQAACQPISAFVGRVLFSPLADYIATSKKITLDKSSGQSCGRLIEALVKTIMPPKDQDANSASFDWSSLLDGIADAVVCKVLMGTGDDALRGLIDGVQQSSENGLTLEVDNCVFYHENTDQYKRMGKPEAADEVKTAYESLGATSRCKVKLKAGSFEVDGVMHACRHRDDQLYPCVFPDEE